MDFFFFFIIIIPKRFGKLHACFLNLFQFPGSTFTFGPVCPNLASLKGNKIPNHLGPICLSPCDIHWSVITAEVTDDQHTLELRR